ncbi:MAG: hypothetical protein U0Z26_01500 [Anaerolineales bacterium]
MKQDKFLTGILIGIGVLILLALGLFFTRQDKREYISEDNPEGVVHNYALAVLNKDYKKAYSYLADLEYKPTYEEFRQSFFNGTISQNNTSVDIGTTEINGDEAIVNLSLLFSSGDPFSGGYENPDKALLIKQSGNWKLNSMPYTFWDYNWYQKPPTP